mgnify:CR=1 FL=1
MFLFNSLAATIKKARPDIGLTVLEGQQSIPLEPPKDFFTKQVANIKDIGAPTTACFFVNSKINPAKWYEFIIICIYLLIGK